jgi:glycogen operon protein
MVALYLASLFRVSIPPSLNDLGVRLTRSGGEIKVMSNSAEGIDVLIYDGPGSNHIAERHSLVQCKDGIWSATSSALVVGAEYSLQAWGPAGPQDSFSAEELLVDPYAQGLTKVGNLWRNVVVDTSFDWGTTQKPHTPLDQSVIYEAHVRGLTKMHPEVPLELRGTYAGLAHPVMTSYLTDLGVTAVELLPVHSFVSEEHLLKQGTTNYWGYNTLNFFTPHSACLLYTSDAGDE